MSEESKAWTAGTWEYREYPECAIKERVVAVSRDGRSTYTVALPAHTGNREVRENMQLCAAAKALYYACKQALGASEEGWAINWDDLRRAIDQADGKPPVQVDPDAAWIDSYVMKHLGEFDCGCGRCDLVEMGQHLRAALGAACKKGR
jgi:hypothetical protein